MPFKYNSLSGKLDLVNPKLDSPLQFKGTITINTDFPLIADVDNGWFYTILADVTDDAGVTYTNTGQSFDLGDEVAWDGSAWVVMGNENVYARLDGTNMPFTGNVGIGTTDFANGRPLRIHSSTANSGVRITNSTTGTGVNKGLELSLSNNIGYLALYENADLKIYTNNSYRASFLAGGDFSVEKDIYMSNNYAKFIQGGSDQYEQYFDGTYERFETTGTGFTFDGGNVGIGITNPAAKLSIIRVNDSGSILTLGNDNEYTGYDFKRNQHNGTLTLQGRQVGYNNLSLAPTSGNIGIGTASPGEKLEVNGKILADDKIMFTQTDGNEYIDSLNDGYLDIGATTGIRLLTDTVVTGSVDATTFNGIDIETAFYLPTPDKTGLISDGTAFVTDDTAGASDIEIPVKDVISITRSGTTCTVTSTAHGFPTDASVTIAGASSGYNGEFTITSTSDDTFTYEVTGTPASPATGTITATNYWIQLTSRSTNKSWAFNFTLNTNAAGSTETHILQITGSSYSSAPQIKYRGVNGYYWISHFRTSVQNNNLKLEAKLYDTTRLYSLSWVAEMVSGEMGTDNGGIEANSFPITGAGRIKTFVVNELDATSLTLTHPGAWIFGDNDLLEFNSFGTYSNGAGLMQKWSDTYYGDTWGRFGMERAATTKDFVWKDMYNTAETTVEAMRLTGDGILKVNDIQTTGSIKGVHKTSDGTNAVADGTYTMGIGTTTNGTITIKDGLITSVTEAVD